ncbi:hypothetical protein MMC31_002159 [Peltigera leucophlebia]|nr:hypothetical protein [Peltigera leucophlebia]
MHERKRLHISPFNPDLLPIVLPQNLLQHATNISFQAIQTLPEKNYGYVDLPAMDAEKLKKKLNGSILRGSKMRVDDARPEKAKKATKTEAGNEAPMEDGSVQDRPKRGKRKAEKSDGVIPGVELPEGRKVRRGWTEPTPSSTGGKAIKSNFKKHDTKPKSKPSSFTTESECLFKTRLPPNSVANDITAKKRKRDQPKRDIIVHEYANTKKHATFLRDNQGPAGAKPASEFVEGTGWIDQDGNILEGDPVQRRTRSGSIRNLDLPTKKGEKDTHPDDVRSSSGIPSIHVSSVGKIHEDQDSEDETSSSGTSSSSASDDEGNAFVQKPKGDNYAYLESSMDPAESEDSDQNTVEHQARGMSINSSSPTTKAPEEVPRDPSPEPNAPVGEIHPLEALFKKPNVAASDTPRKPSLAVSTSFNFFEPDTGEGNDNIHLMPQTPFTQQDFRQRRQRSAAPTPDTAAPGRTFENVWETRSESDDSDDDDNQKDDKNKDDDSVKKAFNEKDHSEDKEGSEEKPGSDFSKWFWEHRGETNRAWKRRRREAAKERRQTVNKKS